MAIGVLWKSTDAYDITEHIKALHYWPFVKGMTFRFLTQWASNAKSVSMWWCDYGLRQHSYFVSNSIVIKSVLFKPLQCLFILNSEFNQNIVIQTIARSISWWRILRAPGGNFNKKMSSDQQYSQSHCWDKMTWIAYTSSMAYLWYWNGLQGLVQYKYAMSPA